MSKKKLFYEYTEYRQYKCCLCGRTMHKPTPHICNGQYRKHNLKFTKEDMNEKTKKLVNALIDYLDIQEKFVLKGGLFIGTTIDDVFEKPYQKELNIKLRYIDEEELKAYRNENGTTKEG